MSMIQPPFRRATIQDASTLAEFVEFASEGLALYLWTKLAGPGRDPWHIGRERVGGETGGLSYHNAIIAEVAGRPAAGLIGYLTRSTANISSAVDGGYSQLHTSWVRRQSGWYERHFAHLDSRAGTHFLGRSALVWTRDNWIACLRGG
jgi:hypothetical protein